MPKLPVIMNELHIPDVRKTAQSLKQKFLEAAAPLVDEYINAALGKGSLSSTNAGAREEVWDVMKKLILQASDKLEIDIQSAEDVLEAVSSGKCTFEEGEKLLNLYKKVKEIDNIGKLGVAGTGGLTINILNANKDESANILTSEGEVLPRVRT